MSFNCCFKGKEKREKGADLFKLEFKGALNKSVPFVETNELVWFPISVSCRKP